MRKFYAIVLLIGTLLGALSFAQPQVGGRGLGGNPRANSYSYAFFEAFPPTGKGTSGACSTTSPTGANGQVLTFTRASNGTCTKTASGGLATTGIQNGDLVVLSSNQPRVEYDANGTLGLLVESSRTNSILRSEALDNAIWLNLNNVVAAPTETADTTTAPDGTTTADTVAYPQVIGASAQSSMAQQWTATAASWTCSAYVKGVSGSGRTYLSATINGASFPLTGACDFVSTSWSRCTATGTLTAALYYLQIGVDLRDGAQATQPAQSVYVWGASCEEGAYATSYIPTVAAALTRVAEVAYLTLPAVPNATGIYSLAVTVSMPRTAGQNWAGAVQSTAGAAPYRALYNSGSFNSESFNGGATQATRVALGQLTSKRISNYNDGTNQYGIYDGATFGPTVGTRTAPSATLLHVGNSFAAGFELDGIITRVCLDGNSTRCR